MDRQTLWALVLWPLGLLLSLLLIGCEQSKEVSAQMGTDAAQQLQVSIKKTQEMLEIVSEKTKAELEAQAAAADETVQAVKDASSIN